ncbi:MAG: AAA family ATPase, partial [Thermotogaceae bacterium]|nr:AAA family ATPase [Thermotogaceae bacterium]
MKLKKIKVHGFKSFANSIELDISSGITAIVGPNGSGKSNILDAIKWLFGEQSLKSLRADEKYDLIFAGSDNSPPARRAYVELVFDDNGNNVSIAREITREGKGVYYINGKVARLKDIRSLFSGTGIGKDFYSVIAQGQVERIVSSSGKELRSLFEEAAGTAIFREKKKEALQKLERVESNLNTLVNVLYEKGKQMESLYLKAKRAERYLEYSERLEEVKKIYYGNLIYREENRKKEIEEKIEIARQKIREVRKELYELESRWSALRESMEEMDEKMKSYTKTIQTYETRKNQLLELKNHYNKKISEAENSLIQVTTKITSFEEELSRSLTRKDEISVILRSLKSEKDFLGKEILILEEEKEKITSEFSEKEKSFLEMRETIKRIEKEIMKIENEILRLSDSTEDMEKRLNMIEAQKEDKVERLKDIESELRKIQENIDATTEKEKKLKEELKILRIRKEKVRKEKEDLLKEINDLLREKGTIQIEINALERAIENYEDFNSTIKMIFRNKERFDGLYDIVANIIEADKEFQKAIEALLGGAINHIVVRDSDVAKKIIEFLKTNDIGRATFLPLDMLIGHPPVLGEFSFHSGFIGMAADLVRVPEGFEKLPSYLFGNDIVVETIDDAIEIKKKYNV